LHLKNEHLYLKSQACWLVSPLIYLRLKTPLNHKSHLFFISWISCLTSKLHWKCQSLDLFFPSDLQWEGKSVICDNTDDPGGHYIKWNKPGIERLHVESKKITQRHRVTMVAGGNEDVGEVSVTQKQSVLAFHGTAQWLQLRIVCYILENC
jgi:hypothetical protein